MVRTQVQLTETQAQLLKQLAVQEKQSIAELIRQAIDLWVANKIKISDMVEKRRRARLVIGKFRSGVPDLSVNHDEYFAQAIEDYPRRTLTDELTTQVSSAV